MVELKTMIGFLLTFFLVYGAGNYYFLHRAVKALEPGRTATCLLGLFLLAMILAPIGVRFLERHDHETAARVVAYLGYCWMGFLFLFLSASLFLNLSRLLFWLATTATGREASIFHLTGQSAFFSCCGLALGICLYGWTEARNIRTEHVVIETDKLPPSAAPLRIAQISDVHIGLIVREERTSRIIAAIKAADPQLIVSTGDLVDGHVSHFDGVSDRLRELQPPLGMFAVTGNHEYYVGLDQALDFTRRSGFRVLQGSAVALTDTLTIAGVDDPAAKRFANRRDVSERELLAPLPRDRFTLFLKHRPVVAPESRGLFDLQLSGHVHKGQIFPFNLITWLNFPVRAGLNRLTGGSALYVSRGTGTWGPPIRFLAPPEVTIIDLVPRP
jgi:uncharacterized protein